MTDLQEMRDEAEAARLTLRPLGPGQGDALDQLLAAVLSEPRPGRRRRGRVLVAAMAVVCAGAAVAVGALVLSRDGSPGTFRPVAVGTPAAAAPSPRLSVDPTGSARDLEIPLHPRQPEPPPATRGPGNKDGALSSLRLPSVDRAARTADRVLVAQVLGEDPDLGTARLLVWSSPVGPGRPLSVVTVADVWGLGRHAGLVVALVDDDGTEPTLLVGQGPSRAEVLGPVLSPGGETSLADLLALRAACREDDACPSR